MHFTMQAENILQELTRKVVEKEEGLQHQDAEHVEHDSEDECTPSMHNFVWMYVMLKKFCYGQCLLQKREFECRQLRNKQSVVGQ